MKLLSCFVALLTVLVAADRSLLADTIELSNGDVLNGQVMSLDGLHLKLKSEVHGELVIARAKVAVIHLGDRKPGAAAKAAASAVGKATGAGGTPEEIVEQLRKQGVSPQDLSAIQGQLATSPEAQKYFNDTVAGLLSGKLSVQDLRKDAVKARDELNALKKDLKAQLGSDADALDGYLSILESFIDQTQPAPPAQPAPQTPPAQPAQTRDGAEPKKE